MLRLWKSLKYAGAGGFEESDIRRAICVGVNTMCISIFVLNLFSGGIFFFLSGNIGILAGAYTEGFLMLGIVALNFRRNYVLANIFFYFVINLATFYFGAILGPYAQVQSMFLFILGLIFFVFDGGAARITCILITLFLLTLLELQYEHPFIRQLQFDADVYLMIRCLVYLVIISLVLLIFYLYKKNVLRFHSRSRIAEASRNSEVDLNNLKNNFFQNISHDIRGAYFGVGSICAVIHDKVQSDQPVTPQLADNLLTASENYKYMLNHFLEFSKFKMGTADEINNELIDAAAEVIRIVQLNQYLAKEKNIRVDIDQAAGFPQKLITDRNKLCRIFYNIFVNALKFSPRGSCIIVYFGTTDAFWILKVTDQGDGFQPEQLDRIFEPYATSRSPENPEGIGLGLYITNYLTRILGGQIDIASKPAAGTTVELRFPLHDYRG